MGGVVFRVNELPGRSTSRYVSTGVAIDGFLSKEAVEVHSLWPNIPEDKWNVFPYFFGQSAFFYFMQSRLCSFAPFSSFGTSAFVLFFCQRFWKLVLFSAGIYFYWMKLGQNWESKVSSSLAYIDCRVAHACSIPELPWASVKQQGDFLRTLQRGWWVSTHPSHYYIMLPYLPNSPTIPTELSAITQTFHTWTVHHSGYWVLKMELETERGV